VLLLKMTLLKNHADAMANRIAAMSASTSRRLRHPIAVGSARAPTMGGSSTRQPGGSASSRRPTCVMSRVTSRGGSGTVYGGGDAGGIGFIGGTVRPRSAARSRASRAPHSAHTGPSSQRPGE
jgi:hypothetical protein